MFLTIFWLAEPLLSNKDISCGTHSWFYKYKNQGIVTIGGFPVTRWYTSYITKLADFTKYLLFREPSICPNPCCVPYSGIILFQQPPRVHFTSICFTNFHSPKKCKPQLRVQKSCLKHFCTKKLLIKCWRTQFQQQNFAQLYQYTQLEVMPNFYILRFVLYASKFSIKLQAQKLLIK